LIVLAFGKIINCTPLNQSASSINFVMLIIRLAITVVVCQPRSQALGCVLLCV
jgi:hypothetical protein